MNNLDQQNKKLLPSNSFYFILFFMFSMSINAFAQNSNIKGILVDSVNSPLPSATIMLIHARDSTMEKFTISRTDGSFTLKGIPAGNYLLQVTYIGFQNISKPIVVQRNTPLDLGFILMKEENELLDNVTIEADRIPIVIKKDTIEYNAGAFETTPGATVEELLKKLPGIEVESDGTIKAQGKEVQKVLVDGKEFFGDDPKIATKNLPADAMDKVQVFDKLSEMAEFTGVDDGNRDKTINLTLKEDKKNGYFGNVEAGYGQDNRYKGKLNINQFTKNQQLSVISSANNINEQNFSIDDYINLSGGLGNLLNGGSGGNIRLNIDEGLGSALGLSRGGIRNNWSFGTNFNKDISKKTELNANYFFNILDNELLKSSVRQNFTGDNVFNSNRELNSHTNYNLHRLNLKLKHQINDQQDITASVNLSTTSNQSTSLDGNQILGENNTIQSDSESNTRRNADNYSINNSLLYRKKFAKKGRSFTGNITLNKTKSNTDINLQSTASLLNNSNPENFENIITNQIQFENIDNTLLGVTLNYTEPVLNGKLLQGSFSRQRTNYALNKDFFDLNDENDQILNEELTTSFDNRFVYTTGGLKLFLGNDNNKLVLGVNAQQSTLKGNSPTIENIITRRFFNILPNLSWRKNLNQSSNLSLNYRTLVREPSIEQLQPVVNNTDPLFIYNGNPNLKTEYAHSVSFNYSLFDQFSLTSIFVNSNVTFTNNKITNQTIIDETFRQTVTPVNVANDISSRGSLSFSTPLRWMRTKISIDFNSSFNRGILFVNNEESTVTRNNNSINLKLGNRNKKVIDANIGIKLSQNNTKYLSNEALNREFLQQSIYASMNLKIKKKWNIGSELSRENFGGDGFTGNQSFPLLKASISRSFLKFDRGTLKFSAFDLLNQNRGIFRNSNFNFVEEERVNVLNRYFLLSFNYALSAFKR